MLIVDNILLLPARGLLLVMREVQRAAEEQRARDGDAIQGELRELYLRLEKRQITAEEFDAREKDLLDRLERRQVLPPEVKAGPETRGPGRRCRARKRGKPAAAMSGFDARGKG